MAKKAINLFIFALLQNILYKALLRIEAVISINTTGCEIDCASHYNRYISDIKLKNINSLHLKK